MIFLQVIFMAHDLYNQSWILLFWLQPKSYQLKNNQMKWSMDHVEIGGVG
jgi:hypothetical protein